MQIDCTSKKPKSINEVIAKNPSTREQQLIIEIVGICDESVIINRRDNIVLRGRDPLIDGIRGVSDIALRVNYANRISVENLQITGSSGQGVFVGDSGLLGDSGFGLNNVRLEGNGDVGLLAFRSLVVANLLVVTSNGVGGIRMGGSTPSRLVCVACTIEANPAPGSGIALQVVRGSNALLFGSVLEGEIGLRSSTAGHVDLFNTMVTGSQSSISADNHARVSVVGGSLTGPFAIGTKSSLELSGVDQPSATPPNVVRFDSYLNTTERSGIRTSLVSTLLEDFSNASFRDTNLGDLSCTQGSNAICVNVNKTSSNCSLCPPP